MAEQPKQEFKPVFLKDQGDFHSPRQKTWIVLRYEPSSNGKRWVNHLITQDYDAAIEKCKHLIQYPECYSYETSSAEDVFMAEIVPSDVYMIPR